MPIFDFVCQSCSHSFERLCLPGRAHDLNCPSCQSSAIKKVVSAPGIQLQGSGWYRDGYGLEKSGQANQD